MKKWLTSCIGSAKGHKALASSAPHYRASSSSREAPALTAFSSVDSLSDFLESRYDASTCGVVVLASTCPDTLSIVCCNAIAATMYGIPFNKDTGKIALQGATELLDVLEREEPVITLAVREQLSNAVYGDLVEAFHLQAVAPSREDSSKDLNKPCLQAATTGCSTKGDPDIRRRPWQCAPRRWRAVHVEPAVIGAGRVDERSQWRLTLSPYRPVDGVWQKAASPVAGPQEALVTGPSWPAAVVVFQPSAQSAPFNQAAGRAPAGSSSFTTASTSIVRALSGLPRRSLSMTVPKERSRVSLASPTLPEVNTACAACPTGAAPPRLPSQPASAAAVQNHGMEGPHEAPQDPGSSEASRLREGTVLSGLSHIVTAFSPDGLQLLYQNELSIRYYGVRSRTAPHERPVDASGWDVGPGLGSGAEGQDGGILAELFELEPAKLDCLLSEVCEVGRIWKGLVQVPASCCKDGNPPLTSSYKSLLPHGAIWGPGASPHAGVDPQAQAALLSLNTSAKSFHTAVTAAASTAGAGATGSELSPQAPASPLLQPSLPRTAKDLGVTLTRPMSSTRQGSLLLGTLDGPLDSTLGLAAPSMAGLEIVDPLATSTWGLMMEPLERLQDGRMSLRRRSSIILDALDPASSNSTVRGAGREAPSQLQSPQQVQQQGQQCLPTSPQDLPARVTAAANASSPAVRGFGPVPRLPPGNSPPVLPGPIPTAARSMQMRRRSDVMLGTGVDGTTAAVSGHHGIVAGILGLLRGKTGEASIGRDASLRGVEGRSASMTFQDQRQTSYDLSDASKQRQTVQGRAAGARGRAPPRRSASGIESSVAAGVVARIPSGTASRMLLFASSLSNMPAPPGVQRALQERAGSIASSLPDNEVRPTPVAPGAADGLSVEPTSARPPEDAPVQEGKSGVGAATDGCSQPVSGRYSRRPAGDEALWAAGDNSTTPPDLVLYACSTAGTGPQAESKSSSAGVGFSEVTAGLLSTANNSRDVSGSCAHSGIRKRPPAGALTCGSISEFELISSQKACPLVGSGRAHAGPSRRALPARSSLQGVPVTVNIPPGRAQRDVAPDTGADGNSGSSTTGRPAETCTHATATVGSLPASSPVLGSSPPIRPGGSSTTRVGNEGRVATPDGTAASPAPSSHGTHGRVQQHPAAACWHEVAATRVVDAATGGYMIVVTQVDVSSKVEVERHLAMVSEAEHRVLEKVFPRHVLAVLTEEEAAGHARAVMSVFAATANPAPSAGAPRDVSRLATSHSQVTLLFADIQGFTPMCKVLEAQVVMTFLNNLFTSFDRRLEEFGVYKVETIGDCYFVAGGLMHEDEHGMPAVRARESNADPLHAEKVLMFAKAMLAAASTATLPTTGEPVRMRVGIHSGPVVSGLVGERMPRFCLFGDTVNTTSRMESTGVAGCIHASEAAYRLLRNEDWTPTGGIEVKGKGLMHTYLWAPPDPACQAILQHHTGRASPAAASRKATTGAFVSHDNMALGHSSLHQLLMSSVGGSKGGGGSGCDSGERGGSGNHARSSTAEMSMLGLAREVTSDDLPLS